MVFELINDTFRHVYLILFSQGNDKLLLSQVISQNLRPGSASFHRAKSMELEKKEELFFLSQDNSFKAVILEKTKI